MRLSNVRIRASCCYAFANEPTSYSRTAHPARLRGDERQCAMSSFLMRSEAAIRMMH